MFTLCPHFKIVAPGKDAKHFFVECRSEVWRKRPSFASDWNVIKVLRMSGILVFVLPKCAVESYVMFCVNASVSIVGRSMAIDWPNKVNHSACPLESVDDDDALQELPPKICQNNLLDPAAKWTISRAVVMIPVCAPLMHHISLNPFKIASLPFGDAFWFNACSFAR